MRKLVAENFTWIPASSGRYCISPVSETVKLCVSSVTASTCNESLTYSILPLALLPGPLTTFSSISGLTVWANRGTPHQSAKRHPAWRARLQARYRREKEEEVLLCILRIRPYGVACAWMLTVPV